MNATKCPLCNENQAGEYQGFVRYENEPTGTQHTVSICDACAHLDHGQTTILPVEIPAALLVCAEHKAVVVAKPAKKSAESSAQVQAFIDAYANLRAVDHLIAGVVLPVGVACKDYLQGKHADPVTARDIERFRENFRECFLRGPGPMETRHFCQAVRVRIFKEVSLAA